MNYIFRIFLAGLLAALPLFLTIVVLVWAVNSLDLYIGPQSSFGQFLIWLGLGRSAYNIVSYFVGIAAVLGAIFGLGLLVASRLGGWLVSLLDGLVRRIPVVSYLYDMANRIVSMVDGKSGQGVQDMKPVWCFFGGKPGAAVLALLPTPSPVNLRGQNFLAVLVPSAPLPFGGALIYVPEGWIEPARERVDDLVSVYVSMGLKVPESLKSRASVDVEERQPG